MLRIMLSMLAPRERRHGIGLLVLALFAALAEAVGIGAVFPVMRLLNDPAQTMAHPAAQFLFEASGAGSRERFVLMALLGVVALFLVKNLFLALVYKLQAGYVSRVEARLGAELLGAYLRGPYADRLARHSADRVRIITAEVGRATSGFLMPSLALATEGLVIGGILALLLWLQPMAALVAVGVVGAAAALLQRTINRRLERLREVRVEANARMYKWAAESLGAIKETQALGREDYFVGRFADDANRYARATAAFTLIGLTPRLVVETLAVSALLLGLAAGLAAGGAVQELVPALTLFGVAAVRIMPSATRILSAFASLRFYTPSVSAVSEGLCSAPREALPPPPRARGWRRSPSPASPTAIPAPMRPACAKSICICGAASWWRWSAAPAPARPRWATCFSGCSHRSRARYASTVARCARWPASCGVWPASFRSISTCWTTPSAATWPSGGTMRRSTTPASGAPSSLPASTPACGRCPAG